MLRFRLSCSLLWYVFDSPAKQPDNHIIHGAKRRQMGMGKIERNNNNEGN